MNETAVCNSSCLIGLERIRQTEILEHCFDAIYIPPAVRDEIGYSKDWLHVHPVQNKAIVSVLETQIGLGESEAIALAMELDNAYIVLDDKKARGLARKFTPRVIGTVGILLRAKKKGIVERIKPILDNLNAVDFRIGDALYRKALYLAREN